mmetsp:Transcript_13697/g.18802  ORF Transcript_13697/g.18802 Transcript_13697/m.18802 type:complete len:300 (+) Transcript_13697:55-954(+)
MTCSYNLNLMSEATDDASLLVLLLEINPQFWLLGETGVAKALGLQKYLEQVVVFINAYLLLHSRNRVAVIAMHPTGCDFLFETPNPEEQKDSGHDPPAYPESVGEQVFKKVQAIMQSSAGSSASTSPPLSGAISIALCYIQRILGQGTVGGVGSVLSPRLLVLSSSPDPSAQYIAVMNSLFAAQRMQVCVDGCAVGGCDSPLLQQAALLSGGIYLHPPCPSALLTYLLQVFAVDTFTRKYTEMPQSAVVDFRASCFCHKRSIDVGYVCSVCLSIFCESCPRCSTCGTEYASQSDAIAAK